MLKNGSFLSELINFKFETKIKQLNMQSVSIDEFIANIRNQPTNSFEHELELAPPALLPAMPGKMTRTDKCNQIIYKGRAMVSS